MRVSQDQIIEALRPVQDPELHRSIVELDMVRSVQIDRGEVTVLIALTVAGCPLRAEITQRVTAALTPLSGVTGVIVDMTVMTADELAALRDRLGGDAARINPVKTSSPGRSIPLAQRGSATRVLGITSGKGGVGKSSITVNVAVALARRGHDVAVLDADVYGFSIPHMLGVVDEPQVIDELIVPPVAHGVRCISIGFFVDEDKPVMWRGPMLHKALEQLLTDVSWGEPDFLLVDMPPGTGDVALSMAQYVPGAEIYVVTTPQLAAQRVAQRSGAMAREINLPLVGVIENMSWFTSGDGKRNELFGRGGGLALAEKLGVPLLAQIPLDPELRRGADTGVPVVVGCPGTEVALAVEHLASRIASEKLTQARPRRVYREELRVT